MESQLNFIKLAGILFANHSSIVLMSPLKWKKCPPLKGKLSLQKKGKDRTLIANWRPISLVNVDAKIISKVMATRI